MQIEFSPQPSMKMTITGENQKELIKQMASHAEVFGQKQCGACNKNDIRWQVRTVAKQEGKKTTNYDYYELVCNNSSCRARLSFGTLSDGTDTLFPKRKDAEGKMLPNGGWVIFKKSETKTEDDSSF